MSQESLSTKRQLKPSWLAECVVCNHLEQTTIRLIIVGRFWPIAANDDRQLPGQNRTFNKVLL